MMTTKTRRHTIAAAVLGFALLGSAAAQLEWMPNGGRQLLLQVLESCAECDEASVLAAADRTREEWRTYLEERGAIGEFSDQEVDTLVAYLEINLPSEGLTLDSLSTGPYAEPLEGPTLTMESCSACHSPMRALISDRDEESWLDFLQDASAGHAGQLEVFDFSDANWRTLAAYLARNMPMDEDVIPDQIKNIGGEQGG